MTQSQFASAIPGSCSAAIIKGKRTALQVRIHGNCSESGDGFSIGRLECNSDIGIRPRSVIWPVVFLSRGEAVAQRTDGESQDAIGTAGENAAHNAPLFSTTTPITLYAPSPQPK